MFVSLLGNPAEELVAKTLWNRHAIAIVARMAANITLAIFDLINDVSTSGKLRTVPPVWFPILKGIGVA